MQKTNQTEPEVPSQNEAIHVFRSGSFRSDRRLTKAMGDLLAPSYEDATSLLERELAHCDTLYAYYEGEQLAFFYMTANENFALDDGQVVPCTYGGLSCAHEELKNSGAINKVYCEAFAEQCVLQEENRQRRLGWATTATPSAYYFSQLVMEDFVPCLDGSYPPQTIRLAAMLRRANGYPGAAPGDHPFALRGVAPGTQYSDSERARIEHVCRKKEFTLFEKLGIDETRGDRLLMFGWLPAPPCASS